MSSQDRAERTRSVLIQAAAIEFDRSGYAGAAIRQITTTAGLTTGALTFHFDSKRDLADAVVAEAQQAVRTVLDACVPKAGAPLDRLTAVVVGLVRALEQDVVMRAAARLGHEREAALENWSADWRPALDALAGEADRAGDLPADVRPHEVADLAALFIRGADLHPRRRECGQDASGVEQFVPLWRIAHRGMTVAERTMPAPG
ncbi:TetR family transcriptional regulator [Streptomyces sp. A3M-1-3]|uniref:TetR family transcriptional regulator n=1 Tax=Streptomyces sp. A3M-1-3 TaxID=2962044 RepID=UPI0020B76FD8|nr:TetR family transcriptional regulator [Streptomyces sp. A3M-1-3]MCP3820212.1 TetR family transcriptional regulator [Streptomyces sp. A3M-1-3]